MEQRLTDLEVKVAFQEHTIAQLDEVIREQAVTLEALQRQLDDLRTEQQKSLAPLENEKPPHY